MTNRVIAKPLSREDVDKLAEAQRIEDKAFYTYAKDWGMRGNCWAADAAKKELKRRRKLEEGGSRG